jgi:hypothetical protein
MYLSVHYIRPLRRAWSDPRGAQRGAGLGSIGEGQLSQQIYGWRPCAGRVAARFCVSYPFHNKKDTISADLAMLFFFCGAYQAEVRITPTHD